MNILKLLFPAIFLLNFWQQGAAQTVNPNSIQNTKHLINAGIGWDYGLSYNLGYAHIPAWRIPFILNSHLSVPSGGKLSDDFRVKTGGQVILQSKQKFKGGLSVNAVYRRYENPLVRLQNFGGELKGFYGYYHPRWFVAGELAFDKAIVTHFNHATLYRETIFADAEDGWYKPAAGGNYLYGIRAGLSFKKSDITLNIGKVISQDFKSAPLIPYYFTFGINYKLSQQVE